MADNEKKVTEYLVPANVSARFELIPGFGFYELKFVAIAVAIGVMLFGLLGLPKKTLYLDPSEVSLVYSSEEMVDGKIKRIEPYISTPIRFFVILIPSAFTFLVVKKEPISNVSLFDNLKAAQAFKKKQKRYLYVYNSGKI